MLHKDILIDYSATLSSYKDVFSIEVMLHKDILIDYSATLSSYMHDDVADPIWLDSACFSKLSFR
jgi:hypothetical protein